MNYIIQPIETFTSPLPLKVDFVEHGSSTMICVYVVYGIFKEETLKFVQIGHFGPQAVLSGHCGKGPQRIMAKLATATLKSRRFVNSTDSKHSPAVEL